MEDSINMEVWREHFKRLLGGIEEIGRDKEIEEKEVEDAIRKLKK